MPRSKKLYRATRNFIVNTFRQNPRVYLSLTAVRRMVAVSRQTAAHIDQTDGLLASFGLSFQCFLPALRFASLYCASQGDACSLQRIHSFLESWGLINWHVDPGSMPTMASPGNFNSAYPILSHSAFTSEHALTQHDVQNEYLSSSCALTSFTFALLFSPSL